MVGGSHEQWADGSHSDLIRGRRTPLRSRSAASRAWLIRRRLISLRDRGAIFLRALKRARQNQIGHLAQAVAFNAFLAIPSTLLLALGIFSNVAGPDAANSLLDRLSNVVPASVLHLILPQSLTRCCPPSRAGR